MPTRLRGIQLWHDVHLLEVGRELRSGAETHSIGCGGDGGSDGHGEDAVEHVEELAQEREAGQVQSFTVQNSANEL